MNPFMWMGFAAVSIPIIVHLLNRQRFIILDWAAQEFLQRALRKHQRKIKLQEWILLLLRCLAIMAIVAMLLRPVSAQSFGSSSRFRIAVVDVSASMQAAQGNISALKKAEDAIKRLLELSHKEDRIEIFILHDELLTLLKSTEVANSQLVLDAVNSLPSKATSLTNRYDLITEKLKPHIDAALGDNSVVEVFVFSDLQKTGLGAQKMPLGDFEDNVLWYFHDCGLETKDNWAVTGLRLESPNVVKDQRTNVQVDVTSYSKLPQSVNVKLFEGKQLLGEQKATVAAGVKVALPFQVTFKEMGARYLRAVMECGGDTLAVDNTRQLGVQVSDALPVVLMDGDPFGAIYWRDETFKINMLLSSRGKKYKIQVYKKGRDDFSSIDLSDVKLLVMANLPPSTIAFVKKVKDFVEGGGALLVSGGPYVQFPEGKKGLAELLPCVVSEKIQTPEEPWKISLTPAQHPEMEGLRKFNLFEVDLVERMHEVTAKKNARILLRAGGRYPLLTVHQYGKGKVAFWASSLDSEWCDIHRWDYLSIFGLLSEHMITFTSAREVLPGKDFSLSFNTFDVGDSATWHPEKGIGVPLKPMIDKDNKNKSMLIVQANINQVAGLYEIRNRSGRSLSWVGVNVDDSESDLQPLSDDVILVKENGNVKLSHSIAEFNKNLGTDDLGKEMWKILLLMALAFLSLEGFLAWFWGNPK